MLRDPPLGEGENILHAGDRGIREVHGHQHSGAHARHPGQQGDVGGGREELSDGDRAAHREQAADNHGGDQRDLRDRRQRRLEAGGESPDVQPHPEESAGPDHKVALLALLLDEGLDDAHAGDRFLHLACDVRGLLLRLPRRVVEPTAGKEGDGGEDRKLDAQQHRQRPGEPEHDP